MLTRIPEPSEEDEEENDKPVRRYEEEGILTEILRFLNEDAPDLGATLSVPEVLVLHSEPELEFSETLRVGGDKTPDESRLLRDYLRLFVRLIPKEIIYQHIVPVVNGIIARAFDDPDGAQKDLEAVAAYYPSAEAFKALLKMYRLRNVEAEVALTAASQFYNLTLDATDPLLWEAVKESFEAIEPYEDISFDLGFIRAVWEAAGANDLEVGLNLAESYDNLNQLSESSAILQQLLDRVGLNEKVVVRYLGVLQQLQQWQTAVQLIEKSRLVLASSTEFMDAWAEVLASQADPIEISRFLETEKGTLDRLKTDKPVVYARLLFAGRQMAELEGFLQQTLRLAIRKGPSRQLADIAELYESVGKWDEFAQTVRRSFPTSTAERFLEDTSRRTRGLRRPHSTQESLF